MFMLTKLRYSRSFITATLKSNHVHKPLQSSTVRCQYVNMSSLRPSNFKEGKYLAKDKIPHGFNIIYRAPMQYYFAAAHHITTLSALLVGGLAIYAGVSGIERLHMPVRLDHGGLVADEKDLKYFAIAFVLFGVAMRYVVMRYPLRIYRNEKQYIAVLDGQLPFTKRRIHFAKGEVDQAAAYGVLPWRESWYNINGSKLILLVDYFKSPSELYTMIRPKDC